MSNTVTVFRRENLDYIAVGESVNDGLFDTHIGKLSTANGRTFVAAVNLPTMPPGTSEEWDELLKRRT